MTLEPPPAWPHAVLAFCGGFLVATLWFDLMFDVQVVGHAGPPAPLPEAVVASIAHYYRRVTTDAHPMQQLIAAVMLTTVLGSLWTLRPRSQRALRWLAFVTSAFPIGLAIVRVFPDAVRLGAEVDSLADRSTLARAIFVNHVRCLASIGVFTVIQILLVALARPRSPDTAITARVSDRTG